jgi:thiol-disulfide isomerase/thioredoxin
MSTTAIITNNKSNACQSSFRLTSLPYLFPTDFWTTQCTRCPDALDKLDNMAQDPKYENVQFISICCDKLDGARDIIEKDDDLRWQNVSHYFMDQKNKEEAKKVLGFRSVPFYVVLDENGSITQLGNGKSIDFDEVPGVTRPEPEPEPEPEPLYFEEEKKEDDFEVPFQLDLANKEPTPALMPAPVQVERVFEMDDFDF